MSSELTDEQLQAAATTTAEEAEGALYCAIMRMALSTDSAEVLITLASAFDVIQGKDTTPEDKPIHVTGSADMLESRFWDDGARVCGFTPRGLPKSKYRYKEGPDHVV